MSKVSQITLRSKGCTSYRQQGYTPPTVSHFYSITHVFDQKIQSRSTMENANQLEDRPLDGYNGAGMMQFIYSPEDRQIGSMTSDPEVGDIYLFTKQADPRGNGLFIVSQVEGLLTEAYSPDFRSISLIKCKYSAVAHGITGLTHYTGPAVPMQLFDVGYNFETTGILVDNSGNEPTLLANGSLQFENVGTSMSPRITFISRLSGLLGGGLRSDDVPQYIYINHGTVPHILYKHDSTWSVPGNNKLILTPHTNAGYITRADDLLTISGGVQQMSGGVFNSTYNDITQQNFGEMPTQQGTGKYVLRLENQHDGNENGWFIFDSENDVTMHPTYGNKGVMLHRTIRKIPMGEYDLVDYINVSFNLKSLTQGTFWYGSVINPQTPGVVWQTTGQTFSQNAYHFRIPNEVLAITVHHYFNNLRGVDAISNFTQGAIDEIRIYYNGSAPQAVMTLAEWETAFPPFKSKATNEIQINQTVLLENELHPAQSGLFKYSGVYNSGSVLEYHSLTRHPINRKDTFSCRLVFDALCGHPTLAGLQRYVSTPSSYTRYDAFPNLTVGPGNYIISSYLQFLEDPIKSGDLKGSISVNAKNAHVLSTVFHAAVGCNMSDLDTLSIRGLSVRIDELFHSAAFRSSGSLNEHRHLPHVGIAIQPDKRTTLVTRTSISMPILEIRKDMRYQFVYSDTGEELSDSHARVVGLIDIVMNYES